MDPSKEPTAYEREVARALFGMFNALLLEGFDEMQALVVLGHMMSGHPGGR